MLYFEVCSVTVLYDLFFANPTQTLPSVMVLSLSITRSKNKQVNKTFFTFC